MLRQPAFAPFERAYLPGREALPAALRRTSIAPTDTVSLPPLAATLACPRPCGNRVRRSFRPACSLDLPRAGVAALRKEFCFATEDSFSACERRLSRRLQPQATALRHVNRDRCNSTKTPDFLKLISESISRLQGTFLAPFLSILRPAWRQETR